MALLKERLKQGEQVFGPFVNLCHPAVLEVAGLAGFDFAIIDTEHGELSSDRAVDMVRAAKLAGVCPVVRVYGNQPELIAKALDIGAEGVQVPQIGSKKEAAAAVRAAKFSPAGTRGCNRYVRAAGYSAKDKFAYFGGANEETAVILQVEGQEGIDNLTDILTVKGIDVLFIGPYDLSASLGIPGQVDHPDLVAAMQKNMKLASAAGIAIGFFVDDVETAIQWKRWGIQYLSFAADVGLLYRAFSKAARAFKEEKV
ncbi:HpcH/HpaI aldolase family protein [Sporomusa termitida]|uniref:5-keto-4-deoxy-D-glucarate aldolase n=1 Tax=Sporomusa termitida TaxID=2377 RepID=A0A517DW68_9FIRM|nr:aldolase/citrate lyase family protein [Sporomusa termitida]QDR81563.1 5-keto-4-deoxy-D-glucarate aldolase [Sporomusa termitida]